jgi:hypothetical protein
MIRLLSRPAKAGRPVGARPRANGSLALADASALGGRVERGHDKSVGTCTATHHQFFTIVNPITRPISDLKMSNAAALRLTATGP